MKRERTALAEAAFNHLTILQVPAAFFFEGAPHAHVKHRAKTDAPSPRYVSDYLGTSDGLQLTKAFMSIQSPKLRRSIVTLVEKIADHDDD